MLGHLIADRYQILEVLGSGNMTKTYLVKDLHHPDYAKCVIKHLIPSQADSDWLTASSQLFAKEAESLKTLGSHSNIPKLLDYFEHQEAFYLVQEFIDGHPLSAELTIGERWEVAEVLQFLKDMLTLLVFVHDQGMIHRDVKPSNIMRRQSDNQLVLIDFGAVKQVPARQPKADGKTSVTVVVGTPGYMSSEQANGKPQPNSDVYSLGMIAIQALTGLLPRQLREDEEGEWLWQEQAEVDDGRI